MVGSTQLSTWDGGFHGWNFHGPAKTENDFSPKIKGRGGSDNQGNYLSLTGIFSAVVIASNVFTLNIYMMMPYDRRSLHIVYRRHTCSFVQAAYGSAKDIVVYQGVQIQSST